MEETPAHRYVRPSPRKCETTYNVAENAEKEKAKKAKDTEIKE